MANPKHAPSRTLGELNTRLLAATSEECRTGRVEPVGELGTVLGLFESPSFHDQTITLAPGEVFCMFTDGLVEARNGNEFFDTERTAAVLERCADQPVDAIAEELIGAVRGFHGDQLVDDLALLLVRVFS